MLFYHFPKILKKKKGIASKYIQISTKKRDKFNVNHALTCECHFDSGDMNVFVG